MNAKRQEILTIKPNRRCDQETIDKLGQWSRGNAPTLVVDLTTVRFVDTYAMVVLLTLMTLWRRDGHRVQLHPPQSGSARNYLARMRFFASLPKGVQCTEPLPQVAENPSQLLPLTSLDVPNSYVAIDELANLLYPQLPRDLSSPFIEAMAEIVANVLEHSQSEIGFLAAQRFEKDFRGRAAPRVQLVIADAGIGIRESLLQAYPNLANKSDTEAIDLALQQNVTSKPGTHSGVGLSSAAEHADNFRGILQVRSGAGLIVRRRTGTKRQAVPWLPGTVVAVELASPAK